MIRPLLPLITIIAATGLSGCSMEAMAEKRVPDDVRAEVNAQIDQLIAGDTGFVRDAFPDDVDNPELLSQIERMRASVPDGEERSRDVVGVMGATEQAYSDTQGAVRSGTYNMAHELAFDTTDGQRRYLLVQTAHTIRDDGRCCDLRSINAVRSDASPMREGQVGRARLFKFLALFVLITSLATAAFLIIRLGGRKARAAQMDGR